MQTWIIPAVGLFGSCIVAFANFVVQRWRYRIDHISASIERVCRDISDAANCATAYWQLDGADGESAARLRQLEAQLVGYQMRLQLGVLGLGLQDRRLKLQHFDLMDFFDRLTGGDFQVARRPVDFARSREVQSEAARLASALRQALALRARHWW